jgi:hypothetical protein
MRREIALTHLSKSFKAFILLFSGHYDTLRLLGYHLIFFVILTLFYRTKTFLSTVTQRHSEKYTIIIIIIIQFKKLKSFAEKSISTQSNVFF